MGKNAELNEMIPVPMYLKKNAIIVQEMSDSIKFTFQCDCGSKRFAVVRNVLSRSEKDLLKPYYDALENSMSEYGSWCTKDENGIFHFWKRLSEDQNDVIEVFIPPKPEFALAVMLKAKCSVCGKEYVLFDSRKNGYDAMTSEDMDDSDYIPHFQNYRKKQYVLEIKIENDESLDAFIENTGIDCSEEYYSNAFSWITIYGIDENGKRRKLFESETA